MKLRRLCTGLLWLVIPLLFTGCGGGSKSAPPSGSITINPATYSWSVSAANPIEAQLEPVVITVKDASGIPLGNDRVIVSLDLSQGTSTNVVMGLMLADPTTGQPTGSVLTAPVALFTSNSGTINLWVDMATGGALSYTGNLFAYSGSIEGTAVFSVTCKSSGTTTC
ncbi:MAG: hypothetical protein M0039_01720 [Pseudomonadota bacterium]|nr:hypothetical protein [Pseudomonadota bacterium]